jgi:hypothetical protein
VFKHEKHAEINAIASRISSAGHASKTSLSSTEIFRKMSLLKQKSFKQIGELFEDFVPRTLLKPERNGAMGSRRLFSKENTFWAFFSQVLDADDDC